MKNENIEGIPKIVKIKGQYVYYEYIEAYTLRDVIEKSDILHTDPVDFIYQFIVQTVKILMNLKLNKIIHKDLKPENILVDKNKKFYLIDFDVSRFETRKDSDTTLFGTRGYASPEHFGYSNTTFKSDMYGLGKIIKEMDYYNNFTNISSKCTQIDPKFRYESYAKILSDLNVPKKQEPVTPYSKLSTKLIFLAIFIIIIILGRNKSLSGKEMVADFNLTTYVAFLLCDFFDYIRIMVVYKSKKVLAIKLGISIAVLIIFISLSLFIELF